MDTDVKVQPSLSKPEWQLIGELLERERVELPAEIHHHRSNSYREELHSRQEMLGRLLSKVKEVAG